jgi:hypothetical protein
MSTMVSRAAAAVRRSLSPGPISEHVLATYGSLRQGLFVLSFAFPLLLVGMGAVMNVPLQQSLSAYYFAFR